MDRRRDRNNELIVAIAVIGTLALALTFGIILSLSRTIDNESDDQATSTAVAQFLPSLTPTVTSSPTPTAPPSATPEPPTPTDTPLPTATDTQPTHPCQRRLIRLSRLIPPCRRRR